MFVIFIIYLIDSTLIHHYPGRFCHEEIPESKILIMNEGVEFSCEALESQGCKERFERLIYYH